MVVYTQRDEWISRGGGGRLWTRVFSPLSSPFLGDGAIVRKTLKRGSGRAPAYLESQLGTRQRKEKKLISSSASKLQTWLDAWAQ